MPKKSKLHQPRISAPKSGGVQAPTHRVVEVTESGERELTQVARYVKDASPVRAKSAPKAGRSSVASARKASGTSRRVRK